MRRKVHFLIGTRWFGVLGPCRLMIDQLVEDGFEVFVFGQKDHHFQRYDHGKAKLVPIFMARRYFSPLRDFLDIIKLIAYVLWLRPERIHSFNPKPALLSFIASLAAPNAKFFIGVTGLGNTFIRAKNLEPVIRVGLRLACGRAQAVFFQNHDDVALFKSKGLIDPEKVRLFIGPGVDLDAFPFQDRKKTNPVIVTCVARLIWQKGIREFVEAARLLVDRLGAQTIQFELYGEVDTQHPDCVDASYIEDAARDGVIKHVPWTDDISSVLAKSDIFVLHSYREGAPRAILEAAASGLPTVGADAIGVRELVRPNVTGYLTPLHDVTALADAVERLVRDPEMRQKMGRNARRMIAEPLSLANASTAQLAMYQEFSDDGEQVPAQ